MNRLRGAGCMRVVVVAHSGGVMVSYLALTDPALDPAALNVDKLVTFGEGWNLALRLTPAEVGMADRLRRDITTAHPGLRWRDFWGSHDPGPRRPAGARGDQPAGVRAGPGPIVPGLESPEPDRGPRRLLRQRRGVRRAR